MRKVIGIDLGGTSIFGGLINEEGQILKRAERDTPKGRGSQGVLDKIKEVVEDLMDPDVLAIGLGSPGCIDSDKGRVLDVEGNIDGWPNTDLRAYFLQAFPHLPFFVENDANVAALCEEWIGAAKPYENFIMITLGTGVGGAIYTEKEGFLKGHSFRGGELGHAILYPHGRACNCGQKGCVDKYLSGSGIEQSYQEVGPVRKSSKEIFRDFQEDPRARQVIDEFCKDLAIYLVSLRNIFDPQAIIVGGGVINAREVWWDKMLQYYEEYSNRPSGMDIVPAGYLNEAGMIGAGRLAFKLL